MTVLAEPRIAAAVKLLEGTGPTETFIYQMEREGVIFYMAGTYHGEWRVAGGVTADEAVMRLCAVVIDGSICTSCGKPGLFFSEFDLSEVPLTVCCWYWNPVLEEFHRTCEEGH